MLGEVALAVGIGTGISAVYWGIVGTVLLVYDKRKEIKRRLRHALGPVHR
jgi:hypothetical protein